MEIVKVKNTENILVVPSNSLPLKTSLFHKGIIKDEFKVLDLFQSVSSTRVSIWSFKPRDQMEVDENYVQLIPYLVLFRGREVFLYQRTKRVGEKRLSGLWSLGLGGHVKDSDAGGKENFHKTWLAAMERELREEVGANLPENALECLAGAIHERATPVGRVHLGFVYFLKFNPGATVALQEKELTEGQWVHVSELQSFARDHPVEPWSKLIIENFF